MSDEVEPGQPVTDSEESEEELQLENEEDDGPGLSLETDENDYSEDEERKRYGLNSPKAKNGEQVTPNTKFRTEAGINSPKQQKGMDWTSANKETESKETDTSGLSSIVTQVPRDDQSPITQVSRDDDDYDRTEDSLQEGDSSSGGFCSCICNLFSCCSPSPPVQKPTKKHIDNQGKQRGTDTQVIDESSDHVQDDEESSEEAPSGLLPPPGKDMKGKRCLVLDLDETLVHSSFKPITTADFIIPVEIDNVVHKVYVMKRPYVDEFLVECAKIYEIVIFTASLSKYADPLLDELDKHNTISHRLFRESCVLHGTAYVKDLRKIGRKLKDTIIVDNSAQSYLFQPKNAVPILSWFDDRSDTQLRDFLPVLNTTLKNVSDVRRVLDANNKTFKWLCNQANQPLSKYD